MIKITLATLLLSFTPAHANSSSSSSSGSTSGSCSGNHKGEYFYAYTYQYAYVYGKEVKSESHSFSFSGLLSGMDKAKIVGATKKHVIYKKGKFKLAVPYKPKAGLHLKDLTEEEVDGPESSDVTKNGWSKLCPY